VRRTLDASKARLRALSVAGVTVLFLEQKQVTAPMGEVPRYQIFMLDQILIFRLSIEKYAGIVTGFFTRKNYQNRKDANILSKSRFYRQ
jgi:hypothetical protein